MSKRRSDPEKKCPKCRIHKLLCFCSEITHIDNHHRVSIIMHHREDHLTTNTATLIQLVLNNSQIARRGLPEKPFKLEDLNITSDETPLFLFPHEDAIELNQDFLEKNKDKKFHLIVPDGTWNQAKKVYRREPTLAHIPCVKLPPVPASQYYLRKTPRADGVCTFEAIMYAMGIIESKETERLMQKTFQIMVERFLKSRTSFHEFM